MPKGVYLGNKGHLVSQHTREKQRRSMAIFFANGGKNGFLGKKQSEHHKEVMKTIDLKCKVDCKCNKHSLETREKMSKAKQKNPTKYWLGKKRLSLTGPNNSRWIKDRDQVKKYIDSNSRLDYRYKDWQLAVYKRDNYQCCINNQDCKGRIEAHHILSYTKFVELRYEINNGITLCHAHHPRKKLDEKVFIPIFQKMIILQ